MRTVIGVAGGAVAEEATVQLAHQIGQLIAENGWVLLTGGRDAGVMAAASAGASEAGGLTVGILPGDEFDAVAPGVDIAIPTGLGDARNAINVLASRVVIALPGSAGTVSEVALALKNCRPVVAVDFELGPAFARYRDDGLLTVVSTPAAAIAAVRTLLAEQGLA